MQGINRNLVIVLVFALAIVACAPEEEWSPYESKASISYTVVASSEVVISGTTIGDPSYSWSLQVVQGGDFCSAVAQTGRVGKPFSLKFTANESDAERTAVARIKFSDGFTKSFTIRQLAKTENPDYDRPWAEQPDYKEVVDAVYKTYYTDLTNGYRARNYSICYDTKRLVSLWVAYPLCSMYTKKNVSRTDEWAYDPLLGTDSSAPFSYYGRLSPGSKENDPYARGHQLPSADRLCCREANVQTFYGTNMTPQLFDHNGGIWSDLEGKVRNIAEKSDTTYVVTGCIVEGGKTVYDFDDKKMTVPTAYFKALLRYSRSSTLGQWNAAAFYLEHRVYSESLGKQHSMSIDELEEITGMDFFVNLKDKVGEEQAKAIEAADPADSSVWW